MNISDEKKKEVWNYMGSLPKRERPQGCTTVRMLKIYRDVFQTEYFWEDVVLRHGLNEISLDELKEKDPETYEHCVGNFWGMLMEIMHNHGVIK